MKYRLIGNVRIAERVTSSLFQLALFISIFGYAIDKGAVYEDNFARQVIWALFGLAAFFVISEDYIRSQKSNYNLGGGGIWLIVIYAFSSATWTVDFSATIKR